MRNVSFLLFLILAQFQYTVWGQTISSFQLTQVQDEYGTILESVYFMTESDNELQADDVLERLDEFDRYNGEELSKNRIYWFAFQLQNISGSDLELFLNLGHFDFIDFFEISEDKISNSIGGGTLRPAWDLTFPEGNRHSVPLEIHGSETRLYLVRVENGKFMSPTATFELFGRDTYENLTNTETQNFWQGIFHGVLWVMIIYNIFFAFIGKDRTYLYYALYMIAISFYFMNIFGYLTKYIYPNHPEFGTYVWLIMQSAAIFYIIFIRKFLDLEHIHPTWFRISKYLLIAVILFVVFKASYFLLFREYGILSNLSQFVLFMGVVFTAGLIVSLFRTNNQLARYFTIGSISLGLGLLTASIIAFTGHPYSQNFFYAIQIGIIFEIFFFSIGLSFKMRETEHEKRKVQEELVKQLKKNEKLQLQYQRELEQKVIERTQKIEDQKEVLEVQKYQLEELNEEKNHLISIVAHDLRNPLTSALSIAQLLESDEDEEEKLNMMKVQTSSLKRMNEMIEKILDIKAIESQLIKFDMQNFDMGKEIHEIIDQFSVRANQKYLHIHKDLKKAAVQLDKNYFRQIAENLISNAIKFSPNNRNIYISTAQVNGKSWLEIRDEGPGFTEEDRKKMFGKFQKLSARPTGDESSTGIGLSIVKKYVQAMEGEIKVESDHGKGSTFRIEFAGNG